MVPKQMGRAEFISMPIYFYALVQIGGIQSLKVGNVENMKSQKKTIIITGFQADT